VSAEQLSLCLGILDRHSLALESANPTVERALVDARAAIYVLGRVLNPRDGLPLAPSEYSSVGVSEDLAAAEVVWNFVSEQAYETLKVVEEPKWRCICVDLRAIGRHAWPVIVQWARAEKARGATP
jgi:hypothetical protein